jgi:pilus assembly protein Flp/PilA
MLHIRKLLKNSKAATAIEYGLIASLIAVGIVGAAKGLGTKITSTFTAVNNNLK